MHFFRFRLVNTALFFLIGILVGFSLKEKIHPALKPPEAQRYQPEYAAPEGNAAAPGQAGPGWEDEAPSEEEPSPEAEGLQRKKGAADPRPPAAPTAAERDDAEEISVEPDSGNAAAAEKEPDQALLADRDQFFKKPAVYAGREIEMSLQMITAKKNPGGWRLNFVHVGPEKKLGYLYVDDTAKLGENPDLRIGYFYRVRFVCKAGATDQGNILSSVQFTGEKADWATGLSAIE